MPLASRPPRRLSRLQPAEGARIPSSSAGISSLLGPTVLSFSLQLYRFRAQLAERLVQILGTALLGSLLSMLTVSAAARAAGLSPVLRLALLSRTTTTALASEACGAATSDRRV